MPRSTKSSTTNLNILSVLNAPINSLLAPSCANTVHILDALPPRCHRPNFDLKLNVTFNPYYRHKQQFQFMVVCVPNYLVSVSSAGNASHMCTMSNTHMPTLKMYLFFASSSMANYSVLRPTQMTQMLTICLCEPRVCGIHNSADNKQMG